MQKGTCTTYFIAVSIYFWWNRK